MNPGSLQDVLRAGLEELTGRDPEVEQLGALMRYVRLLERWNRTYNLTAIRDPAEMISRHVLDSVSVMPWCNSSNHLLDAGTGPGLPGIPLAIMQPALDVILLDSAGKKIRFLNHVKRELALENIFPVQARLEAFETADAIDAIISRAFTKLGAFAEASRRLCGSSTRLLAMKGRFPEQELDQLPEWVKVHSIEKLLVPGLQEDRHLVIMSVIA